MLTIILKWFLILSWLLLPLTAPACLPALGKPNLPDAVSTVDQRTNPPLAQETSSVNLPNFHVVHPYLLRGGEPSVAGLHKLKEMGVNTIIDLRSDQKKVQTEKSTVKQLGMRFINLPMTSKAPTTSAVKTFLTLLTQASTASSPVFVHCAHGSDRTGCMIGIWRVAHDGWSYDETFTEMRKYYFNPKFSQLSETVKKMTPPSKLKPSS
ncbi:MAG: tyrosine-protein phosphatase [Candidatus Melainabacteria bacterium]|nr:tyrosine-protein phosphatase [Candidatus Melainabacteria bacterium]